MGREAEELKKELMAYAEASIERLVKWDAGHKKPTLTAIERIVLEVGKELEGKMAQAVIGRQEEVRPVPGPACPECGKEMGYKDTQPRQVTSLVGELRIERSYYHCAQCKTGIFPLDRQLAVWEKHWSEEIAKQAVWLSGMTSSYDDAAKVMERIGKVAISDSTIWRQVKQWGERFEAQEKKQEEKANSLPQRGVAPAPEVQTHAVMGAGMDGAMVHIRQEGWKELKVGCIFAIESEPVQDKETQEIVEQAYAFDQSYVTHLGEPTPFGRKMWAEAQERQWPAADTTQVLGDGAAWIWNVAEEYLLPNYLTTDWYHATDHLHAASQSYHPDKSQAAIRWYNAAETLLYQGHAAQIASMLTQRAQLLPDHSDSLLTHATYFENNHRLMNYMECRENGLLIGSGAVESEAKQFKARFCGPGMRWSRSGINHLLPIRAAVMQDSFDSAWKLIYSPP